MYHLKLLEIARLLGLSQGEIARHLGITPIQVSRWVKGKRPLPEKHLTPLWRFVMDAVQDFLDAGKADVGPDGLPLPISLATAGTKTAFRRQVETLMRDLTLEYAEECGIGPSAQLASTFVALDAFPRDPKAQRKRDNAMKLIELGRTLTECGTMLARMSFMPDAMEDADDANDLSK